MATKKDLQNEVNRLNAKYCKNTKNHLVIDKDYGCDFSVGLTGKTYKRGNKIYYRKDSLGSFCASIGTGYYKTATDALSALYKADARGWIKNSILYYEKRRFK